MRQIGVVNNEEHARWFYSYTLANGIKTQIEHERDSTWAVWVHDEDHVDDAREKLNEFLDQPDHERYAQSIDIAKEIERKEIAKRRQFERRSKNMRRQFDHPTGRRAVVTMTLMMISIVVTFFGTERPNGFTGGWQPMEFVREWVMITPPRYRIIATGEIIEPSLVEVIAAGQIWRLITPIFLHLDLMHILFNMYMLNIFGRAVELRRGIWKFLGLVTIMAIGSNVAQFYVSGPGFGGMSGVIYGLFGYVWMKSRYDPNTGFFLPSSTVFILIGWLVLCFTGAIGPVANAAHLVGLISGCVAGMLPIWLRNR